MRASRRQPVSWALLLLMGGVAVASGSPPADSRPELVDARGLGGKGNDEALDVAAFPDGSFVITGFFEDTVTFGAGEPNETVLTSAGGADIFVARFLPDGSLAWATRAGGPGADRGQSVAVLGDGSCAVTGSFQLTSTFDKGRKTEVALASEGGSDIFVARIGGAGDLLWARRAGGAGESDTGSGIAVFSDDSLVVTGGFGHDSKPGTATFGPGEPGQTVLTSGGDPGFFLARYGADGRLAWARGARNEWTMGGSDVAAFADGSSVVTGFFYFRATFGKGERNETVLFSEGQADTFLARHDAKGRLVWVKRAGGRAGAVTTGISAFADGSCVVAGGFAGTAVFGPGETGETTLETAIEPGVPHSTLLSSTGASDVFLARYRRDGTLAWARRAGGTGDDVACGLAALTGGSCLVTGMFERTAIFGTAARDREALTSEGLLDAYVARYSPDGDLEWIARAGGAGVDCGQQIVLSPKDTLTVVGRFRDSVRFGPEGPAATALSSRGGDDIFIARYREVPGSSSPFVPPASGEK